jgi:hypothetical protein
MVLEILTAVLVVVLALATVIAAFVGLLGLTGALRLLRCERCDHQIVTSAFRPPGTCAYCRHDRLFHPVYAIHHAPATHWATHPPQHRS